MKRTRRIEIIRYTRRVMSVEGSDATAVHNSTTDPTIIDIIPDEQEEIVLPAPKEENKGASTSDVAADGMPRRRPISKLRDLLRLRW